MDEDVIALERHLNFRFSTSCIFSCFVNLIFEFSLIDYCLNLVFDCNLKNVLFGFFLLSDSLLLTNMPLELVILFEKSLIQFSRSQKLFFGGRLDDKFTLCFLSFFELLFCFSFCLCCHTVAVDLAREILTTASKNYSEISILVLVWPLPYYGLNSVQFVKFSRFVELVQKYALRLFKVHSVACDKCNVKEHLKRFIP